MANIDNEEKLYIHVKDSQGDNWTYEIQPQEMFYAIVDHIKPYFNNPKSLFVKKQKEKTPDQPMNKELKLNQGIKQVEYALRCSIDIPENCYNEKKISIKQLLENQ